MSKYPSADRLRSLRSDATPDGGVSGVPSVDDISAGSTGIPEIEYDEDHLRDLRELLAPTKLRLLQQILATDWGSLSARELAYRNPELTESTIRDHLRAMADRERPFVVQLEADTKQKGVPWKYYAVTEYGIELLKEADMYEGISVLYQAYQAMERTDEIRRIEEFTHRPTPDWL
ncbi:winged helix-turn-helix domain-containing protein [Halomicrococcus sp. NG-SE-24]|uniref:winged helix-turn-helix domain-containing protein n=1 Tax=Halomicrococcus sp. NG-SE-24 TaxID=3436928 RepID=UPI003D97359E